MSDEIVPTTLSITKIEDSNLPQSQKSALRTLYDRVKSGGVRLRSGVRGTANAIRSGGEALVCGAGIAVIESKIQPHLPHALRKLPVDATVGVLGLVAGGAMDGDLAGETLRTAGAVGLGMFAHREVHRFLHERAGHHGPPPAAVHDLVPLPGTTVAPAVAAAVMAPPPPAAVQQAVVAGEGHYQTGISDHYPSGQSMHYPSDTGNYPSDVGEDPLVKKARSLGNW